MSARIAAACVAALGFACAAASAHAGNLVQNGNFESTLIPGSSEFGDRYPTQQVTGWATSGYNFVFTSGTADTTGADGEYGNLQLWGPGNGSANGLPAASPAGGNFIGADGDYITLPIYQTIDGLNAGQLYNVSFYWAAAQQSGFYGDTTESWNVSLGDQTQSTATYDNPSQGFSGWMHQTFTFTAMSGSEVLSFLAAGTPDGVPPFALLDGVSMNAVVPEPATWALMILGVAGVGGMARARRRALVVA